MRASDPLRLRVVRHLGDSLPMDGREGPEVRAAIISLLVGGVWTAFGLDWLRELASGGFRSGGLTELAFILVITSIGLPFLYVGIDLLARVSVRIDASGVRFRKESPVWPAKRWADPLSMYRGVVATRRHRRARVELKILLKHASDSDRDVELYKASVPGSMSLGAAIEGELRGETEEFARLLGVPVLTEREDGSFETREVADLDASVRERALAKSASEEGNDAPGSGPAALPAPSAVEVTRMGEGYVFEARLTRGFLGASAVAALGLGLVWLYFGPGLPPGEGPDWVVPVVGAAFAAFGLALAPSQLREVERLEVTPRGVRTGQVRPGTLLGRDEGSSLSAEEIEEVGLRKDRYGRWRLTVVGDRHRLTWGRYVSRADQRLVRDAILEALAAHRFPSLVRTPDG